MRWRVVPICKNEKDYTCKFQIQQLTSRIEELEDIIKEIESYRISEIGYDDDEDVILDLCRASYGC